MMPRKFSIAIFIALSLSAATSLAADRSCIEVKTTLLIGNNATAKISNNCGVCKSGDANVYFNGQYDFQGRHFEKLTNGSEEVFQYKQDKFGTYSYAVMNVKDCSLPPTPLPTPPPAPIGALDCPGPYKNIYPHKHVAVSGLTDRKMLNTPSKSVTLCVAKEKVPVVDHVSCSVDIMPPNLNENRYKISSTCESNSNCDGVIFKGGFDSEITPPSPPPPVPSWCITASINGEARPYRVMFIVHGKK